MLLKKFQFSFGYDVTARTARRDSFFEFLFLFSDVLTALPYSTYFVGEGGKEQCHMGEG